jgi:hypothetical protein
VSAAAEDLETYLSSDSDLVERDAAEDRTAQNCALAWRVIAFLAAQQLIDVQDARRELREILARADRELRA